MLCRSDCTPHRFPLARRARPRRTRTADTRGACGPVGDSIGDSSSIPAAPRRQAWTHPSGRSVPAASCRTIGNPDRGSCPPEASIPVSLQSRSGSTSGSPSVTIFNGRSAGRGTGWWSSRVPPEPLSAYLSVCHASANTRWPPLWDAWSVRPRASRGGIRTLPRMSLPVEADRSQPRSIPWISPPPRHSLSPLWPITA